MVSQAGMAFQGWDENGLYYPDCLIPAGHPFLGGDEKAYGPALWQASELFHGSIPLHWFYLCRQDRPEANYRIHFEGEDFLDYIPVPARVTQVVGLDQRARATSGHRSTAASNDSSGQLASGPVRPNRQGTLHPRARIKCNAGLLGTAGAVDFARNFFGAVL